MIKCFDPIIDARAKVLILGSMPGKESLRQQQYYAYERNQFWKILYTIFDEKPMENYENKIRFLHKNNIGLWDVLSTCEREGSLDANIRNEKVNDFESFFLDFPNVQYVAFNGSKAESSYKKHVGYKKFDHLEYFQLPSTSPANTTPFEKKREEWKIIRQLVEGNGKA